jgi:hypothetical protein
MNRDEIRLQILLILAAQPGYTANQVAISQELKVRGYVVARDLLGIELTWLDEIASAIVDRQSGGVHIATLTDEGMEHLQGARTIPGIRKPSPGELA